MTTSKRAGSTNGSIHLVTPGGAAAHRNVEGTRFHCLHCGMGMTIGEFAPKKIEPPTVRFCPLCGYGSDQAGTGTSAMTPWNARQTLAARINDAWLGAGKPGQAQLAAAAGVHKSTISRILSGAICPKLEVMSVLAEQLNVELTTFTEVWKPLWRAAMDTRKARPGHLYA
jgi:DNA-binding XRE family transcriptional regulator